MYDVLNDESSLIFPNFLVTHLIPNRVLIGNDLVWFSLWPTQTLLLNRSNVPANQTNNELNSFHEKKIIIVKKKKTLMYLFFVLLVVAFGLNVDWNSSVISLSAMIRLGISLIMIAYLII